MNATRVTEAQVLVADLAAALEQGDGPAAAGLGLDGARGLLSAVATNVRTLDLVDLDLRYIDEVRASTVAGASGFGPDSWQATVAVGYRLDGWDEGPTTVETTFTFAPGADGQRIAGIGGALGRTPLWLTGAVTPVVSGRTLVLSRTGPDRTTSALAQRAVRQVNLVLPDWRGRLVVESPASEKEFNQTLGATQEQYANIAAVTASVDGSLDASSPVHVFLNPALFDDLGPRAAQVVVTHESTHVATRATFTEMPIWLLEGFADYVALAHAGIPVSRAAAQILQRIRKDGVPDALPTDEDLSPTAGGLGATYEEAWLANRFLATTYGEAKLIAFYDAVDSGDPVDAAFAQVLGTTQAAFVKAWRADLEVLSGGVAG